MHQVHIHEPMSEKPESRPPQPNLPTRAFLLGFDRIVHTLFRIEASGLPQRVPRPCLIVANHRRDADIPILGAFLGRARGTRITGVLPHFVAREDLFEPGFLRRYWSSPWLTVPKLISPLIPLDRIMKVFKAHPIHRIPEQSLAIVLGDVRRWLGDWRLDTVLNRWWAARLTAAGVDVTQSISWLLRRERSFADLVGGGWGHRRLNREAFGLFKSIERRRIDANLDAFARELAAGEAVMVAPEGANSPDGYFRRPRAGPYRLARGADPNLTVLPVGLAYDPSMGRRMRVFVHAEAVFSAGNYPLRADFDAAVAAGVLRATTVNGTHLVAHYALSAARGARLDVDGFSRFAGALGKALGKAGLRVATDIAAAAPRRLDWLRRAGLVETVEGGWCRVPGPEPAPGWSNRGALAVFLRNELASVASLAPAVAARFALNSPPYVPGTRTGGDND